MLICSIHYKFQHYWHITQILSCSRSLLIMVIRTSFIVSLLCRCSYEYGDLKHHDEAATLSAVSSCIQKQWR
jgi:hypothetical protein